MKRIALTTAAVLALATAPAIADDAAQDGSAADSTALNDASAEVGQPGPLSPEAKMVSEMTTLLGSDVLSTNMGVDNNTMDGVDEATYFKVGTVTGVRETDAGTLQGIIVTPDDANAEMSLYIPASRVMVVEEGDAPRYMVSYTEDEMSALERVAHPEQISQ